MIAFALGFKHSSLIVDFLLVLNVILVLHSGCDPPVPDMGPLASPRKSI